MPESTDQPPEQHSPGAAIRAALTTMANELATTEPDQPLTNPARIDVALRATATEPAGTFDLVLLITAFVQLPMARREYAAELRRILDAHHRLIVQGTGTDPGGAT